MKLIVSGASRRMPPSDLALLMAALLLMVGGTAAMVADLVSAAIAIPLIAIGIALTVVLQNKKRRGHIHRGRGTWVVARHGSRQRKD